MRFYSCLKAVEIVKISLNINITPSLYVIINEIIEIKKIYNIYLNFKYIKLEKLCSSTLLNIFPQVEFKVTIAYKYYYF